MRNIQGSRFQFSKAIGIVLLCGFFLFSANQVLAAQCTSCGQTIDDPDTLNIDETKPCPRSLVPCGQSCDLPGTDQIEDSPCTFCHLFALIDNILDFVIFKILLPVAALMFIVGGFFLLIAAGKPEQFNKAKSILTATVVGLVIVFAAFIFVGTFLKYIGLAEWTTEIYHNWWDSGFFQFPCQ